MGRPKGGGLRDVIVADLRANGPVRDKSGQAMRRLCERIGQTSKMHTSNVVRLLESEGVVVRVTAKDGQAPRDLAGNASPHARRTYSIGLAHSTEPVEKPAPSVITPTPVAPAPVPPGADVELPGEVDYDLLSHMILKVVFNNLAASEEVAELRAARQRAAALQSALTEARQVVTALGADLERERKHGEKIEEEARQLSLEVEALRAEVKLAGERGIDTARAGRYELRDIVNERSKNVLDQLMRAAPTARG